MVFEKYAHVRIRLQRVDSISHSEFTVCVRLSSLKVLQEEFHNAIKFISILSIPAKHLEIRIIL